MAPSMSVTEYYSGKSIFITGCTGFMGKVLVEKLLRSCPGIKKIYLLMRPKKGQSSGERIKEFILGRVFDRIYQECTDSFSKLQLVPGDILKQDLGLSTLDRAELERECQIVFHCAACVRFDQHIRDAVKLNTGGTQKVLKIAENMKKLEAFVHVSTAYCRCELDNLEERLYRSRHQPRHVMDVVDWMDDELLEHLQPKIIEPQPNTYAYTKSLTEELISQYEGKFPIAIARPSIVTASYKEPIPGWVDNLNGPTGLLVGAGKGVIRTMHCNENFKADIIPVDMVVNGCILLAYTTGVDSPKELRICNITESGVNPLTWGEAINMGRVHVQEYPFTVCLWYPGGSCKTNRLHHQVSLFLTHTLPAYLIDLALWLCGQKTFMVKIQKKVSNGLQVLQYYTTKEWDFKNDNFIALQQRVSEKDNEIFYIDVKQINWSDYIRNYIKGAREFCCNESPSTIPYARKLQRQLYALDIATKCVFGFVLVYIIFYYCKILFNF